ncbi:MULTISPECIES: DUF456 domain-containing protein [Gordonia]|jgi:uncharacterized protein YqgC (DUF456 family)|uniref:DUF456 domain-containing protein n=2 Tax=Gordonia TaxID=2053 RepID=A0A9X3D0M3_9ACTN|nr:MULTISPECIES: DUF456 domain-containing protein [Gordonia]MAU80564.1 hypothetical protein [Gordonia sp. (in: high G+C Gram-positive bacteria)]MCF3939732.1 DUF456 domain-containing protein [Gordonia tangerina]MCX2962873.1 DUF456 domain-containing protein [Gordonia aquimaris]
MSLGGELLIGAVILVGLLGIVFPVLPGSILVALAIGVWAVAVGGWAWGIFAAAAAVIVIGEVVKYLVAGRSLKASGVPNTTIAVGGVLGIIGFFVIPVIGLFIGFVVGAMIAELVRTRSAHAAWRGTVSSAKAAAITIGIELFAALLGTAIWLVGAGIW